MTDRIRALGDPKSKNVFIQMVDDHDLEYMDNLAAELQQQAGSDWCLVTVKVKSWNQDLTPWEAPPVFGNEGFGDGAEETLKFLLESVMISLSGGFIGVGLGYLLSWGANAIGFPATVPMWSVLVSFGVCALIGLLFGYIPAHKAATMDPIEALRYE